MALVPVPDPYVDGIAVFQYGNESSDATLLISVSLPILCLGKLTTPKSEHMVLTTGTPGMPSLLL